MLAVIKSGFKRVPIKTAERPRSRRVPITIALLAVSSRLHQGCCTHKIGVINCSSVAETSTITDRKASLPGDILQYR